MSISNDDLSNWTKPGFNNEEERADNTRKAILSAIKGHNVLKDLSISVFPKGSYANNTNVRRDSDIDIAVRLDGLIVTDYLNGVTQESAGLSPYTGISKNDFKGYLYDALVAEFGSSAVDRSGNKIFRIRESDKILNADVIPCTYYRRYFSNTSYREGIFLVLDDPNTGKFINYPDQHYKNGVTKNIDTKKRYKSIVRIVKNIRNQILDNTDYPSFLIESMAYNVPNSTYLESDTWSDMLKTFCDNSLVYLQTDEPQDDASRWMEVNDHKYLFHLNQKWNRDDAKQLILDLQSEIS